MEVLNFFFSFLRNPRVRLKASCLLLSKVFLEKQNDRIYFWSPFLNFIKSEDVFPINTFGLEKKHFLDKKCCFSFNQSKTLEKKSVFYCEVSILRKQERQYGLWSVRVSIMFKYSLI